LLFFARWSWTNLKLAVTKSKNTFGRCANFLQGNTPW
jgi:hypothetical protein